MSKPALDHPLLYLMLRAHQLAQKKSSERGYAMMLVSIVTVMLFSLLAAYLTITNITRSATNAYTESNSTFYAAESGLNKRSDAVRQRFVGYATPTGVSPGTVAGGIAGAENMAACVDADLTNDGSGDFACQKLVLNYRQSTGTTVSSPSSGSQTATDYNNIITYNAYTFTSDRTTYTDLVRRIPQVQKIPAGQVYAGLNAQEYKYTVYSMATSKLAGNLDARATTVLEMTFKNRNIPLFQFAAFYNGDLEMNSTSQMDINGRVHTNRNLYIQPTPDGTTANTRLLGQVTAANSIYNRVDASTINRYGITRVLLTGDPNNPDATTNTYEKFPDYSASRVTPLTAPEIAGLQGKVLDGLAGATTLNIPEPSFLRKQNSAGEIGEYYGKADLRLELLPKRAAGNVPFNFTTIRSSGTGGSCATFNISVGRQGTINCNQLNEGQRRSLQQPVMAKVVTTDERNRLCPALTEIHDPNKDSERKVLRALQVGIAAQNTPVTLAQLALPLKDSANTSIYNIANSLKGLDDKNTPIELAAAEGACFLPAPIILLAGSGSGPNANYSWESNYFDRREERWIGMLQTNIGSLTVWNRDGLYVGRDDSIPSNDIPTTAQTSAAFNGGNNVSIYDTDSLLFARAAAHASVPTTNPTMSFLNFQPTGLSTSNTQQTTTGIQTSAGFGNGGNTDHLIAFYKKDKKPKGGTPAPTPPTTPATIRSLHQLGFGAIDTTEGGLVFHATVSDDLDDNGTINTTDITVDPLDDLRRYPDGKKKSPYGFAFSDGDDLPGPITIVTDRALYVQGDYNNFRTNLEKQPAALIGDTITVLSSNCDDDSRAMINCGVTTATRDAAETTINAAFLSFTDPSDGNIGSSGYTSMPKVQKYSGGLNNYMRMVEDWGGVKFNYTGSFVSLGTPQEYSGAYRSGSSTNNSFTSGSNSSYYNVPIRNFNYETDFNAFDKLPPLTPKVIYLQQETFKRSYK